MRVGVGLLDVLERYRSFFLTVAIVGTVGLFVPGVLDVSPQPRRAVETGSPDGSARPGIGDCIADSGFGRVVRVTTSCDEADALEVFHTFDVAADTYPDEIDLSDVARRGCVEAFEATLADRRASRPLLVSATPTREMWESAADRQVLCLRARSSDAASRVDGAEGPDPLHPNHMTSDQ